jgi:transcription elongation GreA/GreB family factor
MRIRPDKGRQAISVEPMHAVRHQAMQMYVEVGGGAKALDLRDGAAVTFVCPRPVVEVSLYSTEAPTAGRAFDNRCTTTLVRDASRFIMDKFLLQQQVLKRLAEDLLQAEQAAQAAHATATHAESVAENKYDTLGLEAAYLATGQARRADAIRQAMAHWRQFRPRPYDASKGIELGALVCLVDSAGKQQQLFLGPDGGSMKLVSGAQLVQVISGEAPLGRAMLGKCEGDEVSIQVAPIRQQFEVLRVH